MKLAKLNSVLRAAGGVAALAGVLMAATASADEKLPVKFILNWKYQSVQSGFFVAEDKGYFADEGIDITIDQGNGSSAAIKNVASGSYDAGFGDINALIRIAAETPAEAPIGVYMIYNQPPFVIVTKNGSGINGPADLMGKTLGAPASDATYKLFPAFAQKAGIDAGKVNWSHMKGNLREQMLMRGEVDAVSGYNTTIWFSAKGMGVDPAKDLKFISFADHGMDIYSNSVVVSQKLYKEHPDKVAGLVRAINKGFMDVLADPELATKSLKKRAPLAKDDLERDRFKTVFDLLVFSDEMKKLGLGAIDPARMERSIGIVSEAYKLPATPALSQVFDTKFLPPAETRLVN